MNKNMIVLSYMILSFSLLEAKKNDTTLIGRFQVARADFAGKSKIFVNNLPYDVVLRYRLVDIDTHKDYTQEPIVRRGESFTLDFAPALAHLPDSTNLEFFIELSRVVKRPNSPGHPLVTKPLKNGQLALQMHKLKFLKSSKFSLYSNKNGYFLLGANKV